MDDLYTNNCCSGDTYCNCQDCWYDNDCKEICPVCGCYLDDCPHSEKDGEK